MAKQTNEPRLQKLYKEKVVSELKADFSYTSIMQVPRVEKIIVNMGVGEAVTNKKFLESAVTEISQITGQKAIKTKARKSIANFKLREGQEIGVKVTLRGIRMYEFLDRLQRI